MDRTEVLLDQEEIASNISNIGSIIASQASENKRSFDKESSDCGFINGEKECLKRKHIEACRMSRCPYVTTAMRHYKHVQGR